MGAGGDAGRWQVQKYGCGGIKVEGQSRLRCNEEVMEMATADPKQGTNNVRT